MKTLSSIKFNRIVIGLFTLLFFLGCQNDDSDLQVAKFSKDPNVFIDGFSSGLIYAAFSGTDIFAFQVDNKVTYNNTSASMRFDVPNVNDPAGSYAGGAFFTAVGRDLSSYNALTFWAKSSVASTLGVVGFGIDLGANTYPASLSNLRLSTVWKKYTIPIPDASKLKTEKGMFYISAGPENGNGFSFWIDEVKFENIGTIAYPQPSINGGLDTSVTSFVGVSATVTGLASTFNLLNGTDQVVTTSVNYFNFASSNTAVATVDSQGVVSTVGPGTAVITASIGGVQAKGSLTVQSLGAFAAAPTPVKPAANVITIFSNAYTNAPVEYYNGYWAPYQTTQSADFNVNGDTVLNYTNFNFVGIQFSQPTINVTAMTHMHLDLFIPGTLASGANFKIQLVDFGADGVYGGTDDKSHTLTYTSPTLVAKNWISLDVPFTNMPSLTTRAHLAQIIFSGTNVSNFYADNIYFYKN
ncbi:glycosyl hydrolase family 16 [Flavobacterium restrictum]|uniref:Glycosyl hydrolase family 16 n=1 Tax=Flavobacterium restrictum TaxID=2594428 RepID=A0A553EAN9_9FLAO|nr:glycosyl hydrolase family 16 [Flavobacterium restrictum]TRX42129.1 glycosyl hydrolase family 16 [Flavobacterium restrictum]